MDASVGSPPNSTPAPPPCTSTCATATSCCTRCATDSSLAALENLLALMAAGGIGPEDAAWGCDNLMPIVTATANEADALVAGDGTKRFHFGIETFLDGLVARSAGS